MAKIWANRLIAGDKMWSEVPTSRRPSVTAELLRRVVAGEITQQQMDGIVLAKT